MLPGGRPGNATVALETLLSNLPARPREPWAMAMMLIRSREMGVKMRPARPGAPWMPSPTTVRWPTWLSTSMGFRYPCASSSVRADSTARQGGTS